MIGCDQRLAADLVEGVFDLGQAIGWIDIDQHQPRFGGGELRDHPFRIVRRPDADSIAGLEAHRQQPSGKIIDPLREFAIVPAHLLVAYHQRHFVAPARHGTIEIRAQRLADEPHGRRAVHVALREFRHGPVFRS